MGANRVEHIMGCPISIDLRDEGVRLDGSMDAAFGWLREVDARFSPFRPDSEVCRFDRGEVAAREVSAELREVLDLCDHYERRSGGAFRAWLPGCGFDPCGVVKGWAVQRAGEMLRHAGARRFCINAGGDLFAAGGPWRVGVRHPDHADLLCTVLSVSDGAVATSATYERGGHIIDGRTGCPARGLLSITIIAGDLTTADATATAAFAMGAYGAHWAAAQPGCTVFAVDTERRVLRSASRREAGRFGSAHSHYARWEQRWHFPHTGPGGPAWHGWAG
jgi:thiamine biosynthesis lipoprotein